jgi:PST family polysaccharide transporter
MAAALRGFGLLAGANIIGQALGFAALAIVARRIGAPALGNYSFAVALAAYFGLLASAGVGYVAARDVTLEPGRISKVISESLTLQGIGAGAAYLLLIIASQWVAPNTQARSLLPIAGLSFVVVALTLDWVLLALGSRVPVAAARVAGQVVYAALVPILVTGRSGASTYAWLNIVGLAVTGAIVGGVLQHRRVWRFAAPNLKALVSRVRRSTAIAYSLAMIQLYNTTDVLLLGYLADSRDVGLYAVANRLPYSLVAFANVWIQAFFPHVAATIRDDPAKLRSDVSQVLTAATVVALALASAAAVFPARLMGSLFGHAFRAAGQPFEVLAAAMALVLIEAVLSNILIAASYDRRYAQIVTLAAFVNVGLNVILIPSLAATGSALATLVTEGLLVAMTLVAVRPIVGIPRLQAARLARGVGAVILMCSVMLALASSSVWLAVASGAVVFIVACAGLRVFDPDLWRRRASDLAAER